MSQGNSVPRVSGGVPWWLWTVALLATVAVVLGVLAEQEDATADDVFRRGVDAVERSDGRTLQECLEELRVRKEAVTGSEADDVQDQIQILSGIEARARKRDPRAVEILEPYLDHPNEVYRRLALRFSALARQTMGHSAMARQLHLKWAELDPSDLIPQLQLLRLYVAACAFESVQTTADNILSVDPENREAIEATGLAQLLTGDLAGARRTYASIMETEGDRAAASPMVINNYVKSLLNSGDAQAALEFARQNQTICEPAMRFDIYMESGDLSEDIDQLLMTMRAPTGSPPSAELTGLRAINDGDWELAVETLSHAALEMPRSSRIFRRLKQAAENNEQMELAQACQENLDGIQRLEQQLDEAARAVGTDMQDANLRLKVAELAAELVRFNDASRWIEAAAMVDPDRQVELLDFRNTIRFPTKPLVPIGAAFAHTEQDGADAKQDSVTDGVEPDDSTDSENSGAAESTSSDPTSESVSEDSDSGDTASEETDRQDTSSPAPE